MRVLFVSASPIRKEVSIGNTFLNLFAESENITLASVYTRGGVPDAAISQAFCLTDAMLVKNLLRKTPVGKTVSCGETAEKTAPPPQDSSKLAKFMKRYRLSVFFWAQDLLWRVGRWKSPELQKFVEDFQPDIVFTVLSDSPFLNRLILHIVKISGAKLALYAWDNNYSLKMFALSPLRWIRQICNRVSMRKVVAAADMFYVISEVQKRDYEKAFKKPCKVLTKCADFSSPSFKTAYERPLQLVYTGNLGLNRWKSLSYIVDALKTVNQNGVKAQLNIYSATPLTAKMQKALQAEGSVRFMGSVPAKEIPQIQANADVLVHAEAMDLKNRLAVRQSFSTKLVDYLSAARPIFAVGPRDVASVSCLVEHDAAIVASNKKEVAEKLTQLTENPSLCAEYAQKAWQLGKQNFEQSIVQPSFFADMESLIN